jgi:hypothetical protein
VSTLANAQVVIVKALTQKKTRRARSPVETLVCDWWANGHDSSGVAHHLMKEETEVLPRLMRGLPGNSLSTV